MHGKAHDQHFSQGTALPRVTVPVTSELFKPPGGFQLIKLKTTVVLFVLSSLHRRRRRRRRRIMLRSYNNETTTITRTPPFLSKVLIHHEHCR